MNKVLIFSGLLILLMFAPFPASIKQTLPFGPQVSYIEMAA
jgi:hypothetical protein